MRCEMMITADAVVLQRLDQVEHLADLLDGERRGRLVHDDELPVEGGGAGDGDRLALPAGQILGVLVDRFDVDLQPVEVLRRHLPRLLVVDDGEPAELPAGLAAEIDVLVDRHVPGEREVLVDHLDAELAARPWARGSWTGWPLKTSSPSLGRNRPERIFISVDLPAPLSPTTPSTSPCPTWKFTSRSAVMAPKYFDMPLGLEQRVLPCPSPPDRTPVPIEWNE